LHSARSQEDIGLSRLEREVDRTDIQRFALRPQTS
jgi:hypothetical protein